MLEGAPATAYKNSKVPLLIPMNTAAKKIQANRDKSPDAQSSPGLTQNTCHVEIEDGIPGKPSTAGRAGKTVSIARLKELAHSHIPSYHPLRDLLLVEKDTMPMEEYLVKLEIWLRLIRRMPG